ncbi:hypothetical protein C8R45DRAFT_1081463 [Mycena sanguinolenta]|nr:hypothetical protein C8R45DRAFT_1081463 [Mycena sanguinolenta]
MRRKLPNADRAMPIQSLHAISGNYTDTAVSAGPTSRAPSSSPPSTNSASAIAWLTDSNVDLSVVSRAPWTAHHLAHAPRQAWAMTSTPLKKLTVRADEPDAREESACDEAAGGEQSRRGRGIRGREWESCRGKGRYWSTPHPPASSHRPPPRTARLLAPPAVLPLRPTDGDHVTGDGLHLALALRAPAAVCDLARASRIKGAGRLVLREGGEGGKKDAFDIPTQRLPPSQRLRLIGRGGMRSGRCQAPNHTPTALLYVAIITTVVHCTMGGLTIDPSARVLSSITHNRDSDAELDDELMRRRSLRIAEPAISTFANYGKGDSAFGTGLTMDPSTRVLSSVTHTPIPGLWPAVQVIPDAHGHRRNRLAGSWVVVAEGGGWWVVFG